MGKSKIKSPKYSLEVFDDYVVIRGWAPVDAFQCLVHICREAGFTHMTYLDDGSQGFKIFKDK